MDAGLEANAVRSEPTVEFARKKSPAHATDSLEDLASPNPRLVEVGPLHLPGLHRVSLPRDKNRRLVTANEHYAKEAIEAYKSVRTRLLKSQANQGFRTVAVTSVGKSEGKTLTAFNLAYCCAQVENLTVLLIDGDLRTRSLTRLLGPMPSVGLSDVMSGTASCDEAVVSTDLPNLYIMGAGSSDAPPTELFSTERWTHLIRWSRSNFKIAFVDALSLGAFADFELIASECDGVLMVVRARSTSRESLKAAIDQLDASKLLGFIWNGSD
jgi:capsular exopolysaccharide synthesis family protein